MAPWKFVPDDEPLDRLVIYRTAGTTGHPITVPHRPVAVRCYELMIEFALSRYGVKPEFDDQSVACFLVGAQIRTYTYATVLYNWNGAGFAKLNIRPTEWPSEGSQQLYFQEFSPKFLSGDPIGFSEMMRMGIPVTSRVGTIGSTILVLAAVAMQIRSGDWSNLPLAGILMAASVATIAIHR